MNALSALFSRIESIEKYFSRGEDQKAQMEAKQLHLETLQFVRASRNDTAIPLPFALKTIKLLTSEKIQFCDGVKRELSRTAALISEHIYAVCKQEERAIYPATRGRLFESLRTLFLTLPKKEVTASFAVKCCLAAIHSMTPGEGKWVELAKEHAPEVVKGGLSAGAGLSGGAIPGPLLDLGIGIYKEKSNRSYRSLLSMRHSFLRVCDLDQLQAGTIQLELKKYNQKPKYALCLAEIFARIVLDPEGDPKLQKKIFSLERELSDKKDLRFLFQSDDWGANLCSLAGLNDGKKGYWKARLRSIEVLIALSEESGPYQIQSIAILAFRLAVEREPIPAEYLFRTYKHASPEVLKIWKQYFSLMHPEDIEKKDKALQKALQIEIQGIKRELEENSNQEEELNKELSQKSQQSGGSLSVDSLGRESEVIRKELFDLEQKKKTLLEKQGAQEAWLEERQKTILQVQQERLTLLEEVANG